MPGHYSLLATQELSAESMMHCFTVISHAVQMNYHSHNVACFSNFTVMRICSEDFTSGSEFLSSIS